MAEWGFKQKGWKTAYVLLDNTIAYTKSLCGSFATRWIELAGKDGLLGQDTFLNSDPSIAAQVTRITSLSKKPDVIFFCSYAPGGPSAMRQLRAAGVTAPIVTGESLDGDYWIGSIPDLSNFYNITIGSKYGDDPDAEVNGFFKRFEAKFGRKADVSFDKKPLVIGPTTYTSKLHIQTTRPMAILAATNGKFACVGRFTVESFPPLQ
jgi:branched-chain amino acid transport system substrate-binding protein